MSKRPQVRESYKDRMALESAFEPFIVEDEDSEDGTIYPDTCLIWEGPSSKHAKHGEVRTAVVLDMERAGELLQH